MAFTKVVGPGIHTLANITSHNVHSSGIITATRFDGPFTNLNVTGVTTFSGSVSIGGTLTYEDVTNIDSVGLVTARAGLVSPYADIDDFVDVGSNIQLGNAGVITATSFSGSGANLTGIDATALKDSGGNVKIQAQASGAMHTGVTTITDEVVTSKNLLTLKGTSWGDGEKVFTTYKRGAVDLGRVGVEADGAGQAGQLIFECGYSGSPVERVRITSAGLVGINCTPNTQLEVKGTDVAFRLLSTVATGRIGMEFYDTSAQKGYFGYPSSGNDNMSIQQNEDADLYFYVNGGTRLNIKSTGQVRIDGPTAAAHGLRFTPNGWNGYDNRMGYCGTSGADFWWSSNWNPTTGARDHSGYTTNYIRQNISTGYLSFGTGAVDTSASERMRIKSDGHITLPCTNNVLGFELNPGTGAGSLILGQDSSITSNIRASDGKSNVGGGSGGGSRIRLGKNQLHFDTFPYVTSAGDTVNYTPRLSILSTGTEVLGDLYVKTTYPRIYLLDTDNNSDYSIINHQGNFAIYDDSISAWRLRITADGKIHTGSPATYASDDFNITALGTGATLSLCRASTGNANDNDLLGSIAFQSYPAGQAHTAAEASIKAYAESGQSGSAAPTSLRFYTKPGTVGPGGSASQRMVIAPNGEVFIGGNAQVSDRSTVLSISGTNQDPGGVWTQVGIYSEDSYAQNKGGSIGFGGQDGTTTKQQFAAISGVKETTGSGNYAGMMRFWTRPGNAVSQERMRIQSDGTVKIKDKLLILNGGAFTETPAAGLSIRNGGIYLEQGNDITWNNGDNSIKGESGYHLLFSTYDGSTNSQKMRIRGGSGNGGAKIELVRSNGGFYHQTASAAITPANGDWVYFGYVPYGASKRGKFTVEWASLQAPSCCYHGYTTLSAGSAYGPLYDYTHSESIEIINYDSHGAHNFKAWKMVDHGNYLKVFGQWSGSTVQSGTFRVTSLPTELYDGSSFVVATPAVDNNSYDGTRLTIDGRFQSNVPGYNPDQKRLNKSMFGIFHATSGLDTAGAVTTRGNATGANGTIWCNYGGISPTRNGYAVGSYTPFAGMVAGCNTGARYLHVKFNITGGSMWMIDIKGYEYVGNWISNIQGTNQHGDKIHHSISGGYHYNSNALFNGSSYAYRGINPGWYLHGGYVCCWIDTNATNTTNRWGFYKFEGGVDGIIGTGAQKPSCVIGWTFSTNTNSAF